MARLLVHVEGQTEENFVNAVLRDHLVAKGYHSVQARLLGNARARYRRGGIRVWNAVRSDIVNHLRQDSTCIATTMVDYYALPRQEVGGWPGRSLSSGLPTATEKAKYIENAISEDLRMAMDDDGASRFVPFIVMHEFEGLLFSDCAAFSRAILEPGLEPALQRIRAAYATPEEINDSPETAPSKRVQHLLPGYEKPLFGVRVVLETGLERIRGECPHFHDWLAALESRVR